MKLTTRRFLALIIGTLCSSPAAAIALDFNPAATDPTGLISKETGNIQAVSLGQNTPSAVAFDLINVALSLLAALCMGLLIYAGFLWVWARGNQDEVKKAKDIILGTVLGLVVVLAALGITSFVFTTVANISGATVSTT